MKTLDTRNKIISSGEALKIAGDRPAQWVTGSFDPLLAEHAAMLQAAKKANELLIVEIANPPRPLLSQRARAELVAGLAGVDYVVMGQKQAAADEIRSRFIDHVRRRANGAKP